MIEIFISLDNTLIDEELGHFSGKMDKDLNNLVEI